MDIGDHLLISAADYNEGCYDADADADADLKHCCLLLLDYTAMHRTFVHPLCQLLRISG